MEAKQLKLTFLLAVLMSMVGAKAFAHDIEVANADGVTIYYTYMNNTTELAVSYRGSSYSSYSKEYSGVVNIPESVTYNGTIYPVTSIGELAFFYCSGLTSVTIPNSVTSIGGSAFSLCIGLTSVTIGNSVTSIGSSAFSHCTGLTSIDIPNSVTGIGSGAFSDCTGLTSVTIPNSVTSIGESAFSGCSSLTEINVDENNTAYSSIDGVLFNKSQTELILYPRRKQGTYTIPNSVTSIGSRAFYDCNKLTSVTIPNSVTSIGDRAFSGCTGLTSVTIGNSVTSIGEMAFYGCSSLTEINVDENNTAYSSIDGVLFNKSQTKLIRYPGGKQGAYTIPNSVTSIGYEAFYDCNKLTSVTIPNSVTSIGTRAFSGCRGLTSVTIPNSMTSIGSRAFSNCSSLTSITIPNSVTSIGYLAFYGGLTEINVDENNTAYSSIDGVLFNKSQTELVLCPTRKQGAYTIPNSVTSIGYEAFFGCYKLTSVTIPNSVTSIGYEAFRNCTGLTSVTIPNSVTSIGQNAFEFCYGLTSVTIPNSVTSIGKNAFGDCSGLTDIYCHIEEPLTIASNVFNNVPRNTCTLHVPIGSKVKYKAANYWKDFLNIVEDLPTGIVSIDNLQSTIDNDVWFTINGTRLNGKPTKAGIYIVNGKKVVVK